MSPTMSVHGAKYCSVCVDANKGLTFVYLSTDHVKFIISSLIICT